MANPAQILFLLTQQKMSAPVVILMDNGSLEPAATLALRGLADKLGTRTGAAVAPISLLHSSGVPEEDLGGTPAEILEPALERRLAAGQFSATATKEDTT